MICLGSFLLIPLMYILFRRMVIKPMGVLNLGMQEIEQENLAYRITDDAPSAEFEHMNMVFNEMVEQISTLKIEGYEKDIEKLKMETQNLRLQINPHLLLNSLNMIYSLALSKRTDVITEYTVIRATKMRDKNRYYIPFWSHFFSSSSIALAADCSASFLVRPVPRQAILSFNTASTRNIFM